MYLHDQYKGKILIEKVEILLIIIHKIIIRTFKCD